MEVVKKAIDKMVERGVIANNGKNENESFNIVEKTNIEETHDHVIDVNIINYLHEDFFTKIKSQFQNDIDSRLNESNLICKDYIDKQITLLSKTKETCDDPSYLINNMREEISFLRSEMKSKDSIIELLIKDNPRRQEMLPIANERDNTLNRNINNYEEFISPKKTVRCNNSALGNNFPITTENRYSMFNEENRNGCNKQKQNDEYSRDTSGKHYQNKKRTNNKRNITILGTSIIKDIKPYKMNKSLEPGSKIYVKPFSGAKVSCMRDYVKPSLRYNPDLIILGAGANDLKSEKTAEMISDEIIDLASDMKSDTNEIMVSGIVPRNDDISLHEKGERVNELIREMCHSKGLGYVDNSNINPNKHLNGSGVHLNYHGTSILAKNFLNAIKI